MKRAIVFAGGGTKGAYQAGFVKALRELDIDYDIVTGTSIGALNGCLLAQQDYEAMYELWRTLDLDDIMEDGIDMKFTFENMINQSELIRPFLKSYIDHKGANIQPLKDKINELANEERLQSTHKQFGLVTVEYPKLIAHELTYDQMKGSLKDYLLASASCFPAFPIHEFNGHSYIDGGYHDNLPIDLAFKMGADEVIAVEITYGRVTHPHYENRPNITVVRPSLYNGQFLDFDKGMLDHRQKLGYNDTMKKLGGYLGKTYTFYPYSKMELAKNLYMDILNYEGKLNDDIIKRKIKIINNLPLSSLVVAKYDHPSYMDHLITAIEVIAEFYQYDPIEIYHVDMMIQKLKDRFYQDLENYKNMIPENMKSIEAVKLKETLDHLSKIDLICYLYLQLTENSDKFDENWIYPFFPEELLCAFLFKNL